MAIYDSTNSEWIMWLHSLPLLNQFGLIKAFTYHLLANLNIQVESLSFFSQEFQKFKIEHWETKVT